LLEISITKLMKSIFLFLMLVTFCVSAYSFNQTTDSDNQKIVTGADQPEEYLPYLKGKRVGILANSTSIAGGKHLVDFLLSKRINVVKTFGPEHGFRGNASAGVKVADERNPALYERSLLWLGLEKL